MKLFKIKPLNKSLISNKKKKEHVFTRTLTPINYTIRRNRCFFFFNLLRWIHLINYKGVIIYIHCNRLSIFVTTKSNLFSVFLEWANMAIGCLATRQKKKKSAHKRPLIISQHNRWTLLTPLRLQSVAPTRGDTVTAHGNSEMSMQYISAQKCRDIAMLGWNFAQIQNAQDLRCKLKISINSNLGSTLMYFLPRNWKPYCSSSHDDIARGRDHAKFVISLSQLRHLWCSQQLCLTFFFFWTCSF